MRRIFFLQASKNFETKPPKPKPKKKTMPKKVALRLCVFADGPFSLMKSELLQGEDAEEPRVPGSVITVDDCKYTLLEKFEYTFPTDHDVDSGRIKKLVHPHFYADSVDEWWVARPEIGFAHADMDAILYTLHYLTPEWFSFNHIWECLPSSDFFEELGAPGHHFLDTAELLNDALYSDSYIVAHHNGDIRDFSEHFTDMLENIVGIKRWCEEKKLPWESVWAYIRTRGRRGPKSRGTVITSLRELRSDYCDALKDYYKTNYAADRLVPAGLTPEIAIAIDKALHEDCAAYLSRKEITFRTHPDRAREGFE